MSLLEWLVASLVVYAVFVTVVICWCVSAARSDRQAEEAWEDLQRNGKGVPK